MSPDGSIRTTCTPVRTFRLDRGASLDDAEVRLLAEGVSFGAFSRFSSIGLEEGVGSFWLVLRGSARIECKEGRFQLPARSWVALGREAKPSVQVERNGLVLMLSAPLPTTSPFAIELPRMPLIYPARGRLGARDMRLALRVWRDAWRINLERADKTSQLLSRTAFLLSTLQCELSALLAKCPGRTLMRRQHVMARLQRALLFLDGNHHRTVRLEELARMSNFSAWYFTKTFQAVYGTGMRELTTHLRLRAARDLLASTGLSISEVGSRCGFQNPCSFSRAFSEHYGRSPSWYRKAVGPHPPFWQSFSARDAGSNGSET